jgi:hypothetical protein
MKKNSGRRVPGEESAAEELRPKEVRGNASCRFAAGCYAVSNSRLSPGGGVARAADQSFVQVNPVTDDFELRRPLVHCN